MPDSMLIILRKSDTKQMSNYLLKKEGYFLVEKEFCS